MVPEVPMRAVVVFRVGTFLVLLLSGAGGCGRGSKQEAQPPSPVSRVEAPERTYEDDTAHSSVMPGDGGQSREDRLTTHRIRRAIMADEQLAPAGSNVVITTTHGRVTVKGKVGSRHEERAIAAMVEKQTGDQPAVNEVQVNSVPSR